MKSGDQNWVSVSRAIKPFAEPGRPPDWFSQKHCASQYSELLECTEAPKRKRGEKGEVVETVEDVIVRRLTAERIEELKKLIKDTQEKHRKLKREAELIQAGHLDSRLDELWGDIVQKQEEEEAEVKRKATDAAYQGTGGNLTIHLIPYTLHCFHVKGAGSAVFTPVAELAGAGLVEVGLSSLLEDCSNQKKLLGQKTTPPPSPLLSELLKKGSLLSASPRLEEKTLFNSGLYFFVTSEAGEDDGHSVSVESKASMLEEEDLVTVSYMADELDLETVGDIIAIIEDKVKINISFLYFLSLYGDIILHTYTLQLFCYGINNKAVTVHGRNMEEDEGVSDAEEGSVLEAKAGLAGDGGEECGGDEEGEGVEGYLSEAEGETELEPPASESEDGCSMHTASSSLQLHTTADSIPSSPASSQFSISSEDQEAIQAQKIWKKAIMLVWRAAANHRYANVFLQPVTDDIAPGYHSIVHRPMDLSTIKKNIENGLIRTTAEFQRDIMLMFQNAVMYNSSDHDVFHMAVEMQRDVLEQIQQFLATQLIMQTSESGISAKSLRGREANRKQDPNDKDSVPMASPAFLLSLFDGGTRGRRCAIEADLKMKK
uniref:Bromodomain-containing protein 8 n=1 Tax=Astyanax mexicanus TaxID=7994 RepID=A0A8B9RBR2_ASTMX